MRHIGLVAGQHVDLLIAVHRVPEVEPRTQLKVAQFKNTFEQQDWAAPAQIAHALCFIQIQEGKAVGGAQALKGAFDAVPISVGLDDGPEPGVCDLSAAACQVVPQGGAMDGGKNRTWHGASKHKGQQSRF